MYVYAKEVHWNCQIDSMLAGEIYPVVEGVQLVHARFLMRCTSTVNNKLRQTVHNWLVCAKCLTCLRCLAS